MIDSVVRHAFDEGIDVAELEAIEPRAFAFNAGKHLFLRFRGPVWYPHISRYVFEPSGETTKDGHKGLIYPLETYEGELEYMYPHAIEMNIEDGVASWYDHEMYARCSSRIAGAASIICSFAESRPNLGREIGTFYTQLMMEKPLQKSGTPVTRDRRFTDTVDVNPHYL